MAEFYTYLHCKPNGIPFYVGKGSGKRAFDFSHHSRTKFHRNVISKHGVKIFVFPCESEEQAFADEIQQIAQLRREGYELCNLNNGGRLNNGHSTESRKKISIAMMGNKHGYGKIFSDERKAKISKALKGNKNGVGNISGGMLGRKHSEITKIKMSKPRTQEQKQRISIAAYKREEKKRQLNGN